MECITTGKELTTGGNVMILDCLVCQMKTKHNVSYGGMFCLSCETYMSHFDDFTEVVPKLMSKHNIKSKRELGEILKMKKGQVYKYYDSYLVRLIITKLQDNLI